MRMIANPVVLFAGGRGRIDVNRDVAQVRQMMQELMPHFTGNFVPVFDRELSLHRNVDIG